MGNLIQERVQLARQGKNDTVVCRLRSGWVVVGDVQFHHGYCLLLVDPLVDSLNDLSSHHRIQFLSDMAVVGDVLLEITGAYRINYEILGNSEPALHAHIFPRYADEPDEFRQYPAWFYDWKNAPSFNKSAMGCFIQAMQQKLVSRGVTAD